MTAPAQTFVGRERELARLDGFLERALGGAGQVCLVCGEPGSGKSALAQEFVRRAQPSRPDLLVVFGDCNAQTGAGDAYLPFREILAQLTGDVEASVAEGAITKENGERLKDCFNTSGDVLLEVGTDLLGIFLPGAGIAARLGTRLLRRKVKAPAAVRLDQPQIFEQYTEVLRRLARHQPLILVLDDLQWADSASTALLFHIARRIEGSRLLVIGTYRPEDLARRSGEERHPLAPVLAELKRYYGDAWIDLDQPDMAEQRRFVDALIDAVPNRLDERFRDAFFRHTEGHPLFSVELLRHFQEQGSLTRDAEERLVQAKPLQWSALPARVEGVIEVRLTRLEPALHETLVAASVEGESFTAEVLAKVLSVDERDVIQRLSRDLEKQHQVVKAQGTQHLGARRVSLYRFRHNLFQKYLYGTLDVVERSYLHDDVGRALEEIYGDAAPTIAVKLAHQFREAGDQRKAAGYLEQAGDAAAAAHAHGEARLHYAQALDALSALHDTIDNQRRRVDLTIKLGQAEYAREAPNQNLARLAKVEITAAALPEAHTPSSRDALRLTRVRYWMGRFCFLLNAPHDAIRYYESVLEVAPALGDAELIAMPASAIGRALVSQGNFAKATSYLWRALEPLEKTGDVMEWIQTCCYLATALSGQGKYAEALEQAERARKRAIEIDSPRAIGFTFIHTWAAHMHAGNASRMLEAARATVQASERSGDAVTRYLGLGFLAWAEAKAGRYAEAAASIAQCRATADALGGRLVIADWFAALEAEIALKQGRMDEAIELVRRAIDMARSVGDVFGEALARRVHGCALAADPAQWIEAEQEMAASVRLAEMGDARPEMARTHVLWAALCQSRGDHAAALAHYREAEGILAQGVTALDLDDLPTRTAALSATGRERPGTL